MFFLKIDKYLKSYEIRFEYLIVKPIWFSINNKKNLNDVFLKKSIFFDIIYQFKL